ncbi:CPBP family intramembrane metalloprotease, partial [Mycobacterium colombiense]
MAAALVGWSLVGPRLPATWRTALQAVVGGALALIT